MTPVARWFVITLTLHVAILGSPTRVAAQEGDGTVDGRPRHGYYVTRRPHRSLSLYCGFSGGDAPEMLLFRKSLDGRDWVRVGSCNSSTGRGPVPIAVGEGTRHFIFPLPRGSASGTGAGWNGRTRIIDEASNDCGVRLRYSDAAGNQVRIVLLDPAMAFGHGVPITPLCDPLLDHYDHF